MEMLREILALLQPPRRLPCNPPMLALLVQNQLQVMQKFPPLIPGLPNPDTQLLQSWTFRFNNRHFLYAVENTLSLVRRQEQTEAVEVICVVCCTDYELRRKQYKKLMLLLSMT